MSYPVSYNLIAAQGASGIPQALLKRAIERGELAAKETQAGPVITHESLHAYVSNLAKMGGADDLERAAAVQARMNAAARERGRQIALRALGKKA